MTKQGFIDELRKRLKGLPKDDFEKLAEYYSEMIDDRIEDGLSEESAVKAMGSVDGIVEKIIDETSFGKLITSKVTPKRKLKGLEIALIIAGFPIWFPLLVSGISVCFLLYLVLWILILCMYIIVLSFAVSGVYSIAACIVGLISSQPLSGFFVLGCGLFLFGVSVPIFFLSNKALLGSAKLTGICLKKAKSKLIRKA